MPDKDTVIINEGHPFDKETTADKLHILRQFHGMNYNPPYIDSKYKDLNKLTQNWLDSVYKDAKIAKISEGLEKLAAKKYTCPHDKKEFDSMTAMNRHLTTIHGAEPMVEDTNYQRQLIKDYNSPERATKGYKEANEKAEPKKEGEDLEKPKEKPFKKDKNEDFNHTGAKLKQRIAELSEGFDDDWALPKTSEKKPGKGDPQTDPVKPSTTKFKVDNPEENTNQTGT